LPAQRWVPPARGERSPGRFASYWGAEPPKPPTVRLVVEPAWLLGRPRPERVAPCGSRLAALALRLSPCGSRLAARALLHAAPPLARLRRWFRASGSRSDARVCLACSVPSCALSSARNWPCGSHSAPAPPLRLPALAGSPPRARGFASPRSAGSPPAARCWLRLPLSRLEASPPASLCRLSRSLPSFASDPLRSPCLPSQLRLRQRTAASAFRSWCRAPPSRVRLFRFCLSLPLPPPASRSSPPGRRLPALASRSSPHGSRLRHSPSGPSPPSPPASASASAPPLLAPPPPSVLCPPLLLRRPLRPSSARRRLFCHLFPCPGFVIGA
jgi:hypothetical protein